MTDRPYDLYDAQSRLHEAAKCLREAEHTTRENVRIAEMQDAVRLIDDAKVDIGVAIKKALAAAKATPRPPGGTAVRREPVYDLPSAAE